MIQLISRNGTLFSIIDGKEIQCKDQEQAFFAVQMEHYPYMSGPEIKEGVIYSVPGYTVRVEESTCSKLDIGCKSGKNSLMCRPCENPKEVSILSLEAHEKDEDVTNWCIHHWNNACNCAIKCCDDLLPKTTELPIPNKAGEQPAQPVDKQEGMVLYDAIKFFGKTRWSLMGTNMQNDIIEFANFIDSQRVSPSLERGESDELIEDIMDIAFYEYKNEAIEKIKSKYFITPKPPKQ